MSQHTDNRRKNAEAAFHRSIARINRAARAIELVKLDYLRHEDELTADERDIIRYAMKTVI